jgi:hypothetical protein
LTVRAISALELSDQCTVIRNVSKTGLDLDRVARVSTQPKHFMPGINKVPFKPINRRRKILSSMKSNYEKMEKEIAKQGDRLIPRCEGRAVMESRRNQFPLPPPLLESIAT